MSTSVNFNLAKLQEYSKQRWFKTNEIYQLLKNVENSNLRQAAIKKLPEKPANGSFFFVEGSAGNRKWKHDGHAYVKRSNGVGFREDVVYLKIAGVKVSLSCITNSLGNNVFLFISGP
jgi:CG-1 domain